MKLKRLLVSDFRSISGSITLPLDAPIVLIHGSNGTGKTTVMSAIELALTGQIAAMASADEHYESHLVNKAAERARIALDVVFPNGSETRFGCTLDSEGVDNTGKLAAGLDRFFAERCYLAQASLGRLLEIYQKPGQRKGSPLSLFVQDMLNLEPIIALIDGLAPAADVRNTRKAVPEYAEAESAVQRLKLSAQEAEAIVRQISAEVAKNTSKLDELLASVGLKLRQPDDVLTGMEEILKGSSQFGQIAELTQIEAELELIRGMFYTEPPRENESDDVLKERLSEVRAQLHKWRSSDGQKIDDAIGHAKALFPMLPSVVSTDPATSLQSAMRYVDTEMLRCIQEITVDDTLQQELERTETDLLRSEGRLELISTELEGVGSSADSLARALTALVPNIEDNLCPVCKRDFREVSSMNLVEFVSAEIASLTGRADRISELIRSQASLTSEIAAARRNRDSLAGQRLSSETRTALKVRVSQLNNLVTALQPLRDSAIYGTQLAISAGGVEQAYAKRQGELNVVSHARTRLGELAKQLGITLYQEDSQTAVHALVSDFVSTALAAARERQSRIDRAEALTRDLRGALRIQESERQALREIEERRDRMLETFAAMEDRRLQAKELAKAAAHIRLDVIGRVFNRSLNKIWRELFVRLAPNEPFVPAFRLPEKGSGAIEAELLTQHPKGVGGAPGAMLSAGNLNTAALTLFLALHLSTECKLPWLLLDDPIQSMDEMHISNFAALLRTLKRDNGKQVIVAVHERPLFEYLKLELSPAYQGDRLISIELSKSVSGTTLAEPTIDNWQAELAVAV